MLPAGGWQGAHAFYGFRSLVHRTWGGLRPLSRLTSPASLAEMLFHPIRFPLQGPEQEWELEAFPLSGLAPGAFLVSVLELSLEPSLEPSLELPFPVSLSSTWGNFSFAGLGVGGGKEAQGSVE